MAKILIADDEVEIRDFFKQALEMDKHTVLTVDSGKEVIASLKKEKPDLLILDVIMPGRDGYSIQKIISEDKELSGLSVIVVSALEDSLVLFKEFEQVAARMTKPMSATQLCDAARNALARKSPSPK